MYWESFWGCDPCDRVWKGGWCYLCVPCESGLFVYMAGAKGIPAHVKCTQYSIMLHLYRHMLPIVYSYVVDMAIPYLFACGCLSWIVLTSPAFMMSSSSHPADLHNSLPKPR